MNKPENATVSTALIQRIELRYDRKDVQWAKQQVLTNDGWEVETVEPDLNAPLDRGWVHLIAFRTLRTEEIELKPIPLELCHEYETMEALFNDNCVWVNDEDRCLGRYSRRAAEVFTMESGPDYVDTPTEGVPSWDGWINALGRMNRIRLTVSSKPDWAR